MIENGLSNDKDSAMMKNYEFKVYELNSMRIELESPKSETKYKILWRAVKTLSAAHSSAIHTFQA